MFSVLIATCSSDLIATLPPRGLPAVVVGTSQVRLPLTSTRIMALKPPFPPLHYCFEVLRPLTVSPPPRSFLPMGIEGWHRRCLILAMLYPGDALTWRRLYLATPHLSDASPWRRLPLATPTPGDTLCSQPVYFLPLGPPWGVPPCVDFDFGQRPGTGRYIIWRRRLGLASLEEGSFSYSKEIQTNASWWWTFPSPKED